MLSYIFSELHVIDMLLQPIQEREIREETITTKFLGNQISKLRVCLVKPPSRGNTIGNINEFVNTKHSDKIFEDRLLNEFWVKRGYAVNFMGSNNSEVCHPNALRLALFNYGHFSKQIAVLYKINAGDGPEWLASTHFGKLFLDRL